MLDYTVARENMIESQVRPNGITDRRLIDAMAAVPREQFVPEALRPMAYMDRAVPLESGRFLAAPLFYGRMLEEAEPRADDEVLVVSASAYVAELVRPLVAALDVVRPEDSLAGGRKRREYTLLLVDGAVEELPAALTKNLTENARIVTGMVSRGVSRLATGRKVAGQVALTPLAEMGIPVLPEFAVPRGWSF